MKGFDLSDLNARTEKDEPGWLARHVTGAMTTVQMALSRYKKVDAQIAEVVATFDRDVGMMMRDLVGLDAMFDDSRASYRMVVIDIAAGNLKLKQEKEVTLPALRAKAGEGKSLVAQDVADLVERIETFEQRIYDLNQMKAGALLTMPQIRNMQIAERMLIARVQSMLQLAIPMWRQQIATLIVSKRMEKVAHEVSAARDFTSELLETTAAQVRRTNVVVRQEASKSLFDEDALKKATEDVVGMFNDTITMYEAVASKRAEGMRQMAESEADLRKVMLSMNITP
jgi:uncharacterized protein YaaN involved in tellurite resistance